MKKILIPALILVLSGCHNKDDKAGENTKAGTYSDVNLKVERIIGIGRVEPELGIIKLAANSGGIVASIDKFPGTQIRKNDILVRLDGELDTIRLDQLKSQYRMQESQKEIDELSLNDAASKLENKEKLLSSVEKLVAKEAESQQRLNDLETEVISLKTAYQKAKASIAFSEQKLNELAEQVRLAKAEADRKNLRSPYDGTLLDLYVKKGGSIQQYGTYAEIAPKGKLTVRSEIDELFANRISTGLPAEIRYIGNDSTIAKGRIIFVSPFLKKKSLFSEKAADQEDRLVREIRIELDEGANILYNTEVECVINL